MDNCKKSCFDCKTELNGLLSDVPSKWREQIVNTICETVVNYGLCCADIMECINNEVNTLDYSCLANSQNQWETYSFIQKLQVIINKACESVASGPDFSLTSDSLVVTPGGVQGHDPVIELIPSADAGNILELGTDGKPFVPTRANPSLVANDSNTIDFNTSGSLDHTITANVRLDPNVNNLITSSSAGLFVDAISFSPNLTFNNGLTRTANNVQLGGSLLKNTTIDLSNFYLYVNGINNSGASFAPNEFWILQSAGANNPFTYTYQLPNYFKVVGDLNTSNIPSYYASAYLKLDIINKSSVLGSYYPNTDNVSINAPNINTVKTAYFKTEEGNANVYASKIYLESPLNPNQTSGALISGRRYQITAGGGTFNLSGASNNNVGTIFVANNIVPVWNTGSVRLLGEINNVVFGNSGRVSTFHDNTNYGVTAIDFAANIINIVGVRPTLNVQVIADYSAWLNNTYYAWGEVAINSGSNAANTYTRIGHYTPQTNDSAISAPPLDVNLTSMITFTDGLTTVYSKQSNIQGAVYIKPQGAVGGLDASAQLQVDSTTKGFLPPKHTQAQRIAIPSPAEGLMVYQTDNTKGLYIFDGSQWRRLNWT